MCVFIPFVQLDALSTTHKVDKSHKGINPYIVMQPFSLVHRLSCNEWVFQ